MSIMDALDSRKEPLTGVSDRLLDELKDIRNADTTKLAYIGDAVYEVYVRMNSIEACGRKAVDMNRLSVHYVKADNQARAAKGLLQDSEGKSFYTEEEVQLFKRARNRTNTSHSRGSTNKEYKLATGFEAVAGWLYITGEVGRLSEIVKEAMRIIDSNEKGK